MAARLKGITLGIFLSLILALGFAPALAFAAPGTVAEDGGIRFADDPIIEVASVDPGGIQLLSDSSSSVSLASEDAAVEHLLSGMIGREASVSFALSYTFDSMDTAKAYAQTASANMVHRALEEGGRAQGGDYLRWSLGGYSCSIGLSALGNDYTITYAYLFRYYTTAAQEAELMTKVDAALASMNLAGKSTYEKVCSIYDYICENVTYDSANLDNDSYTLKYTAYAAMTNKTSVCQGYAALFYLMAEKAGVDTRIITGTSNSQNHAWNIVRLDNGLYYNLDSTWDAESSTYGYFLKSDADFAASVNGHTRNSSTSNGFALDYTAASFYDTYPMANISYGVIVESKPENFKYWIRSGRVTITGYTGDVTHITIPSEIEGRLVTSIGYAAFEGCSELRSVVIPEGVTSIEDYSFSGCASLESFTLPSSVTSFGFGALSLCSSLTSIGVAEGSASYSSVNGVLFDVSGKKLVCFPAGRSGSYSVPNSVTSIANSAFNGCDSLGSVFIPSSVTSIGIYAFYMCSSLESINVDEGSASYSTVDGVLFDASKKKLICVPAAGKSGSYSIPDGVTDIYYGAFSDCSGLSSITIPDSVTMMWDGAFSNCTSLLSISIPSSLDHIGNLAFKNCASLESVVIPSSVTAIGDSAFEGCSSLESIPLSPNTTYVGLASFRGCSSLESVRIPIGVSYVGSSAFDGCSSLQSIEVAEGNLYYSSNDGVLFDAAGENLIRCPERRAGIYSIPVNVSVIYGSAFLNCSSLTSIVIPSTVANNIGAGAFLDLANPSTVVASTQGQYELLSGSARLIDPERTTVLLDRQEIVASAADFEYEIADGKVTITKYLGKGGNISIPAKIEGSAVTTIGDEAFANYTNTSRLTGVTVPEGVTSIGEEAFYGCSLLEAVALPSSLVSVGAHAFAYNSLIESIVIPEGVVSLGEAAFLQCTALESVSLPASLKKIGGVCFANTAIKSITIPEGVTSIEQGTFTSCSLLESVSLPASLKKIGMESFRSSALKNIVIPNGVTSVGMDAFSLCSSLESVSIPKSVTEIGTCAFGDLADPSTITVSTQKQYDLLIGSEASSYVSTDRTTVLIDMSQCEILASNGVYSGSAFSPVAKVSLEGGSAIDPSCYELLFYGDVLCSQKLNADQVRNAGTYYVVAEGCLDGKVVGSTAPAPFEITKAALTATYVGETILDAANFAGQIVVTGFVGNETASTAEGYLAPTVDLPTSLERGSEYSLKPSRGEARNYSFDYVEGKLCYGFRAAEAPKVIEGLTYTGNEQTGVEAGVGYVLSGTAAAIDADEYEVIATLLDEYEWSDGTREPKDISWEIAPASLSDVVFGPIQDQTVTGSALTPALVLSFKDSQLVEGVDYSLSYSNNVSVGSASAKVTGIGNFSGEKVVGFTISPTSIESASVASIPSQPYTGFAVTPVPTVMMNDVLLAKDTDYSVSYENNVEPGQATILITGKGNFTGEKRVSFGIAQYDISGTSAYVSDDPALLRDGVAEPKVTVIETQGNKDHALIKGVDFTVEYANNDRLGQASALISGIGDYYGTLEIKYDVVDRIDISQAGYYILLSGGNAFAYTGEPIEPEFIRRERPDEFIRGVDYTVTYENNVNRGTATAIVKGIGDYCGAQELDFAIVGKTGLNISDANVYLWDDYDGTVNGQDAWILRDGTVEPIVTATIWMGDYSLNLVEGVDFEVSYSDNNKAGWGTATLTGINDVAGSKTVRFLIVDSMDIANVGLNGFSEYSLEQLEYLYTGQRIKPKLADTQGLVEGKDFLISYGDNINVGKGTVTLIGLGHYTGEVDIEFDIVANYSFVQLADCTASVERVSYTGESLEPAFSLLDPITGEKLIGWDEYRYSYSDNVEAGTGRIIVTYSPFTCTYSGRKVIEFEIEPASLDGVNVSEVVNCRYTGEEIEPGIALRFNGKEMVKDVDYSVSYEDNIEVGTAKIVLKGIGNFKGERTVEFQITAEKVARMNVKSDLMYNGLAQSGVEVIEGCTLSGVESAVNADEYVTTVTPNSGYAWSDGSSKPIEVSWSIEPATLTAKYKGETIGADEVPALTVNVEGFKNGESAASASGFVAPTVVGPLTLEVGKTYELLPAGGKADNYKFEYVSGILTVEKKSDDGSDNGSGEESGTSGGGGGGGLLFPMTDISTLAISGVPSSIEYEGEPIAISPSVYDSAANKALVQGTDFTVAIKDSLNAKVSQITGPGTYEVTISGTGLYSGTATFTVTVTEAPAVELEGMFADVDAEARGDYESLWYAEYLEYVVAEGLMGGYTSGPDKGKFGTYDDISRGQVATILYRAACAGDPSLEAKYGSTTDSAAFAKTSAFSDARGGLYYTAALNWAKAEGVMTGDASTSYRTVRPDAPIARQELCVMLARYANGGTAPGTELDPSMAAGIRGMGEVASWAKDGVNWAVNNGVIGGVANPDGTTSMNPADTTWRAAAAKMLTVTLRDVM